jgi:hypothetical protein
MKIKGVFGRFALAVVTAMGLSAGCDLYNKLKRPDVRAKIKNKFKKVKDALKKE